MAWPLPESPADGDPDHVVDHGLIAAWANDFDHTTAPASGAVWVHDGTQFTPEVAQLAAVVKSDANFDNATATWEKITGVVYVGTFDGTTPIEVYGRVTVGCHDVTSDHNFAELGIFDTFNSTTTTYLVGRVRSESTDSFASEYNTFCPRLRFTPAAGQHSFGFSLRVLSATPGGYARAYADNATTNALQFNVRIAR